MALRATQQFILGLTTLTLPAPKQGSIHTNPRRVQNAVRAADGTLFVDDKGVVLYDVEFSIEGLTRTNADSLWTFYNTYSQGSVNSFTWWDHEYRTWAGTRFGEGWSPDLSKEGTGRYSCSIRLITASAFGA